MTRSRRTAWLLAGVAVVVVLAVVAAMSLFARGEWLHARVEAQIGDVLDMEVRVAQPVQLRLLPSPHLVLRDLTVEKADDVVAAAEHARVRLSPVSWLLGRSALHALEIEQLELWIERYRPGVYNIVDRTSEPEPLQALALQRLRVAGATVHYLDVESEREWLVEGCALDVRHVRHAGGLPKDALASLGADGDAQCQALRQGPISASDLQTDLTGSDGVFRLEPVGMVLFDGTGTGSLEIDFTAGTPAYALEYHLEQFDLSRFMDELEPDQQSSGRLDIAAQLNARGDTWDEVRGTTDGVVSLNAGKVTIEGFDLDEELDGYAATQRFDLIDVGAVFLAGPVGLAVTRGHRFASLLRGSGERTEIEAMVSEWEVDAGVATSSDVALRTAKHRLALQGGLNFGEYQFESLRVAVVDVNGCAIVEQRITGPFRDPKVESPNVLVTVIGPLIDLVRRGVQTVTNAECQVFYSGALDPPQ